MIPTAHIAVKDKNDIAKTVLMPGDPLRAKYIAENYLKDYKLINSVRNMFAYTGYYNDRKITVFGSGMGMPSIGIYSYELFKLYEVENIIRIGSAGAYTDKIKLNDVVLTEASWSESSYAVTQNPGSTYDKIFADEKLNKRIEESAKKLDIELKHGVIHSTDVFYRENHETYKEIYTKHNCICVEMESFALFHNAKILNKAAACLVTISDSLVTNEGMSSKDRETSLDKMIQIALNA